MEAHMKEEKEEEEDWRQKDSVGWNVEEGEDEEE